MKTLVLVVHPNLQKSIINKRWVKELNHYRLKGGRFGWRLEAT